MVEVRVECAKCKKVVPAVSSIQGTVVSVGNNRYREYWCKEGCRSVWTATLYALDRLVRGSMCVVTRVVRS